MTTFAPEQMAGRSALDPQGSKIGKIGKIGQV